MLARLAASAQRVRLSLSLSLSLVAQRTHTCLGRFFGRFYVWLDQAVFPLVVRFVTHPLTIGATMLLLVPLLILASVTWLVLLGNTYLNVASASVSSIVLMQSLKHHAENKRLHARHAAEIAKLREDTAARIDRLHTRHDHVEAKLDALAQQAAKTTKAAPRPSARATGASMSVSSSSQSAQPSSTSGREDPRT